MKKLEWLVGGLVMTLALCLATPSPAEDLASVDIGSHAVRWDVGGDFDHVVLTVSLPNGNVIRREIRAGLPVVFEVDAAAKDGAYRYELRGIPRFDASLQKELAAARKAGNELEVIERLKDAGRLPREAAVQSGVFTVKDGALIGPDLQEERRQASKAPRQTTGKAQIITAADQVIPDDLIVQGSGCFGFDCVNNESFGFDTIRLKENNLRIKAEDTSVGAFPTNDWQLTFNDSASGGASKFSVEDITGSRVPMTITAGATTNSIFVDSSGRVGFRTSTPVLDLHVNTSNTPALRLEQNNSGGFTAQTWDVAGNEANFFVRDVTGGSRLPFRIRPGAATSSLDISSDGEIGIGTGSPQLKVHVFSTETTDANIGLGPKPGDATGPGLNIGYSGGGLARGASFLNSRADASAVAPNPSLRLWSNDVQRMIIDNEGFIGIGTTANPDAPIHYTNGGTQARLTLAGAWTDASSRDAKEDIYDLEADVALKALRELKPVHFVYKVLPTDAKVGFIAEDVPEIVATPERQNLSALDIVAVVTKVVQEQQKTIDQLNERIAQLEQERQQ